MLSVALAGLSGLVWGIGDFAGGKAAQRAAALPVAWVSKLVSLPLLAVFLLVTYVPLVPASLAWGALAGAFGMVGLMLFYRALSAGAMTVVAPVTAVTSAAIPVVVGLVDGERPPAVRLAGVACALVAIALVSLARPEAGQPVVVTPALVGWSVLSGAGFALFFVFTARASDAAAGQAGLWPIGASRLHWSSCGEARCTPMDSAVFAMSQRSSCFSIETYAVFTERNVASSTVIEPEPSPSELLYVYDCERSR